MQRSHIHGTQEHADAQTVATTVARIDLPAVRSGAMPAEHTRDRPMPAALAHRLYWMPATSKMLTKPPKPSCEKQPLANAARLT